jgi:hypothetical protein
MRVVKCGSTLFILLAVSLTSVHLAHAQTVWMPPTFATYLRVEFCRPLGLFSYPTATWYFSGAARLSSSWAVLAEIPIARYTSAGLAFLDDDTYQPDITSIGNPYLALSYGSDRSWLLLEAGVRLPVYHELSAATIAGIVADATRAEAFEPDHICYRVRTGAHWQFCSAPVVRLRCMVGASYLVPTVEGENEWFGDADAGVWIQGRGLMAGAVLATKVLMTESRSMFHPERSELQLGVTATYRLGPIEPGVQVRLPLTDYGLYYLSALADPVLGLNITAHLGGHSRE